MKQVGYSSITFMQNCYAINDRKDFDKYFTGNGILSKMVTVLHLEEFFAYIYVIRNASVIHIPYTGGVLGNTGLAKYEAWFL